MEVITKKAEQMERVKELAWLKLLKSLTEPLVYPKIFLNILAAGMCKVYLEYILLDFINVPVRHITLPRI